MMRPFKAGDSVIICDDIISLRIYGAESCANKCGTIIDEIPWIGMSRYIGHIPNICAKNKVFEVEVGGWVQKNAFVSEFAGRYMILDLHMSFDIDSLPYDEWVRARDWNKVYENKSEQIIRSLFAA